MFRFEWGASGSGLITDAAPHAGRPYRRGGGRGFGAGGCGRVREREPAGWAACETADLAICATSVGLRGLVLDLDP